MSAFPSIPKPLKPGSAESGLCDVMMLRINLLDTVMVPVLEIARKNNVGIMARESLSNGLLTGRFDENTVFGPDDQRSKFPRDTVLKRIRMAQQFKFLVRADRTLVQAAIQWVLSLAGVSTVTVGADTIPELEENAAVSDMAPLTAGELAQISEIQGTD
jgi:aryl-alcohol dehydrogenase-like predicted oxidoreductase